jgi:hypothetical protein
MGGEDNIVIIHRITTAGRITDMGVTEQQRDIRLSQAPTCAILL